MVERKVQNIEQLLDDLSLQYERLVKGDIKPEQADATSKLAGSILLACRVQLEYNRMNEISTPIKFLDVAPKSLGPGGSNGAGDGSNA